MRGGALEKRLGGFLVENTGINRAIVQLAKCEQRGERDAAIPSAKGAVGEQREKKCGDLLRERWVSFAAEGRHLRTLDGIDQPELRFDDAGMRLRAAEFDADCAMKIDEILDGEVANAAVNR